MTIILWDIPSVVGPWSPNTWKVRFCLNLKKIPYRTEWVEYPDIAPHCQKLGIAPTGTKRDGTPYYSLPAIHDPATGVYLSDSFPIAEYLDRQYPDSPQIFSHNTVGLQAAFEPQHDDALSEMWDFAIPAAINILNPASQGYFRVTREQSFGKKLEDVVPAGDKYVEQWAKVEVGYKQMAAWYAKLSDQGPFIMGAEPVWADFVVGGHLIWFKATWGEEDIKWKSITSWNGGVWKKLFDALQVYTAVN